mmetsp:Transcript_24254/g.34027  ORF Transcript_24254/g.34027 Transcript_24254/m.34027 type:complete len:122 (-) Transcript_24254:76-441(-)|eukprot:CAMPEP_0168561828 /NCGR_PEP_ID=MMETSP0413-20121227/11801_1 /TAXON_ID=136452 /ORGANISM="Filamoeba nolandi, Strain NC-AS-23-1" /LENGTH=121 /DNA_ID=CAMNT_0008593221 /DNA_START=29 /DNA_END=394 /DNA_ORIENTATION=-
MADNTKNVMRIWVVRSDSPHSNRPEYWFFEDQEEATEWHEGIMDDWMDGEWDKFIEENPEYKDKHVQDVEADVKEEWLQEQEIQVELFSEELKLRSKAKKNKQPPKKSKKSSSPPKKKAKK